MLPKHYSEQQIKHFFTAEGVDPRPASWEVSLHTANPGTGTSYEVTDAAYARQPVTLSASDEGAYWEAANTADVEFPAAGPGASYTVTHFIIRDAGADKPLATGALPVPIPVVESGVIVFAVGDLIVRGV